MDMNSVLGRLSAGAFSLLEHYMVIFAWASLLPSYLEGQCEGLDPWNGNKTGSHAFIIYTLIGNREGD